MLEGEEAGGQLEPVGGGYRRKWGGGSCGVTE